jgi:hypothetical protein
MKRLRWILIFTAFFLVFNQGVLIAGESADDVIAGEKLVGQLWADMKTRNIEAIEKYISPGFQSVHEDGARDREAELQLIKGLNMEDYKLSNIKVTRTGPVITVTYFVKVSETIEGKHLLRRPAARLSAWLKTDTGWQWIIHANLISLK